MSALRVERDASVAVLTLDRPDVLNAFDEELTAALAAALAECARDRAVRAVVITGSGRAFSTGQDLRDRALRIDSGEDLHLGAELERRYHPIIRALRALRVPVVAAVNGACLGAGLGVALACDLRLAAASATFRAAWARIGLAPDAGAAYFLPRLVGWGRAMDLLLTGDEVTADEAARIGLVTRVWPDADFPREWRALARRLADGATEAFALTKEALAADEDLASFLTLEASLQERAGRTRDYAEGVRAFREKRPAKFEGA